MRDIESHMGIDGRLMYSERAVPLAPEVIVNRSHHVNGLAMDFVLKDHNEVDKVRGFFSDRDSLSAVHGIHRRNRRVRVRKTGSLSLSKAQSQQKRAKRARRITRLHKTTRR